MATNPGIVPDRRVGPFDVLLDGEVIRRYAAATRDRSAVALAGEVAPVALLTTHIWDAQEAARPVLVTRELNDAASGGVHGEHDIVLHRPIVPGEPLLTSVEASGCRPAGRNTAVTFRYVTVDRDEEVVAEQWWTTVYLGATAEVAGDAPPEHAFPPEARDAPVGTYEIEVDDDMARRYAEVSGDWSPHHFDIEAARRSGADRPFLHGLCTMALCGQAVTELTAAGDPARLRRIAVRFASPMPLGEQLRVHLYDAGPLGIAFEADCDGTLVITHGRAELR